MLSHLKRLLGLNRLSLADVLADSRNRDEFLGMKPVTLPTPESIRRDAAKIVNYSEASDYKVFVDEAWGRIISQLDKILDDRSTDEMRRYYCGSVKATLDLLRVSYVARSVLEEAASLQQKKQG